jgi:type II secretory pathway pseudopilin PulG
MALSNKENKVKPKTYQSDKIVKPCGKTAFTIIELLTVMSIIIILIGLLVPSLNMAKRYAKEVRQKAQFHSIDSALELFSGGWDGYPPSSAKDGAMTPASYCGAMKLCEALVGQDLMGFHPLSQFRADCTLNGTDKLYDNPPSQPNLYPNTADNLRARRTYLQQTSDAYKLKYLYADTKVFDGELYVLCDVYNRVKHRVNGKGIGMPILYYKANPSNTIHDPCSGVPIPTAWNNDNGYIYNYLDNQELVDLGLTWNQTLLHPLSAGNKFYDITQDKRVTIKVGRPYKPDSYILISAGFDGIYGTDDDIFNFEK